MPRAVRRVTMDCIGTECRMSMVHKLHAESARLWLTALRCREPSGVRPGSAQCARRHREVISAAGAARDSVIGACPIDSEASIRGRDVQMLRGLARLSTLSRGIAAGRLFHTSTIRKYPIDMEKVNTTERLAQLRELMKRNKVDIYSKPSGCTWTDN